MVTLQILVLSFLVRVRVSQLESIFHSKDAFFLFISQNDYFIRKLLSSYITVEHMFYTKFIFM